MNKEDREILTSLIDSNEELAKSIVRIEYALIGDKKMGVEGIAQKVEKNSKYVERDKKFKWTAGALIATGGASIREFFAWIIP